MITIDKQINAEQVSISHKEAYELQAGDEIAWANGTADQVRAILSQITGTLVYINDDIYPLFIPNGEVVSVILND